MTFPFRTSHAVPLYLAPMAGVSESPFRRLCRRFGADVVVTEFLSAEGIRRENEATLDKLRFGADERPIGVQIFGADPVAMGEAASLVTEVFAPEFIDINFGCPVKKVVKRNGGSGCLKDLSLVTSVIRSVSAGTHLPVTVKIRSGWSEEMRDPVAIALRCQDAGARALALHPRTRAQMYTGAARWDEIAAVVDALEIPVIGNGDIRTAEDVVRMHAQTGCAAVMVARGSFGQPWVFSQARALLGGFAVPPAPPIEERFAIALEHARMAEDFEPDRRGAAIEFRKHLGWYVKGLPGSAELRRRLHAVESIGEVEGIFGDYLAGRGEFSALDAFVPELENGGDVNRERVLAFLERVAAQGLAPSAALEELSYAPVESLGFATVDHHRGLRQGFPEVIFGQGKSPEQIVRIAEQIAERGDGLLVTRADDGARAALIERFPDARANILARTVRLSGATAGGRDRTAPRILIVTAGTSDLPVAEEASETALAVGCDVDRLVDVGVAGIHRLLAGRHQLTEAAVIIVVAGMDGALPSVVGGLVSAPVIAVPTSVGYGSSFGGLAALLTMLNSCAAGVSVVNIDNGFGAAMAAARIVRSRATA